MEAKRFTLPLDWKTDRPRVHGLTIDGEGTLDRDDAIAIDVMPNVDGGYVAQVSIADVGSFLGRRQTPAIESHARRMGETRYLREGNEPMIPVNISENVLSILRSPGELETPVLTASIAIQPDGTVGDLTLARQRLKPFALTYNDAAKWKAEEEARNGENPFIKRYEDLALLLREKRLADGAVEYTNPRPDRPGELIVQEFMLLANRAVAEFMAENNIPGIYRNFQSEYAYYSPAPEGHAALGLPGPYAHFTSPLRRFADFVNHANIVAFMEGRDFPYEGRELQRIANRINGIQERARLRRSSRQSLLGRGALHASRQTTQYSRQARHTKPHSLVRQS
jgi:ribonuclease R